MILTLFTVLLIISLTLVILGLVLRDHSELALIGFTFLFLLGMIILNGNLQYETGANITTSYGYSITGTIANTSQQVDYKYADFSDNTAHNIGLYLAALSVFGFVGVIVALKPFWRRNKEDE